jgi:predicted Zn-dependent protease
MKRIAYLLTAGIFLVQLTGCQVNPVTGERHFQMYGSNWEQQVGAQMYTPLKQSQGGEFILDPSLTSYVNEVGNRLAAQARRKDELEFEFSILNNSTPNAWALPGGKLVVNRGLLTELDSEGELAAVLGHEIVHADAAHGARQQSTGMLAQIGAVASMVVLGTQIENESARQIAMLVPTVGAQLIMQKYGRDAERESDEYGMRYMAEAGYDPQGAVELQKKFVELSKDRNEDWLSGLFASHPPSQERVQNNRETAAGLPAGGEVGRTRYQSVTAYLRKVQPAYEAYDEAGKALSENKIDRAQQKLNQAMAIEPREALFMAMQGDIHALRDKPTQALSAYNKAISANGNLFYGYLRKGQLEYQQGNNKPARSSLEKSLQLLPTAEAYYVLGMIDRAGGDNEAAIRNFTQAAQSNSAAGKRAKGELVRLDLRANPSRYVATRAVRDSDGYVWVQVGNMTNVPIQNIEISVAWLDERGQTRQGKKTYRGPLGGGQQDRIRLDLKMPEGTDLSSRVRVQASSAAVAK